MRKTLLKTLYCILIFGCYCTSASAQLLPIPDWARAIGGTGESKTSGLVVDKDDNVYVAGNFQGALTVGSGANSVTLNSFGNYDVFVAKYNYDGQLLWATRFGGANLDQVNTMAVDLNGNAYLACLTQSPNINSAPRTGSANYNGDGWDALLVKIDNAGEFKWARKVGGSGADGGHMASTDKDGNVIFVGYIGSNNINLDGWILNPKSGKDGFIVKYDTDGNVIWAYTIGSVGDDEIYGVRVNSRNEIAITAYVSGDANLNPKGPVYPLNTNSSTYYLAKYTNNFDLIWANTIIGTNNQSAGLAMNGSDEMYVNGTFSGSVTFNSTTPGNSNSLNSIGARDIYITKYGIDGDIQWTRRMKGSSTTIVNYNVVADLDDNVYLTGYFAGTLEFGDAPNNKLLTFHGVQDTFFGKYDSQGNFIWAFNFGSSCIGNFGHKIAVDSKKNVFLGGRFCGTIDFNPGNCELNLTAQHSVSDAFVVKYNQIKLSGEPIITSFSLAEQTANAQIDVQNKTIEIFVHPETDLTKLKPNIALDIGTINPLSGTEQDFSSPKTYTISSNCIDYAWTVKVNLAQRQQTEICASIPFLVYGRVYLPGSTFQWEIQDENQNWINAPQASNLPDYQSPGIDNHTAQDIISKFRRKVSLNGLDSYDSEIHMTIYPSTSNNTISADQTMYCDGKASLTIKGSTPLGAGNLLVYSWQQSLDGNNWTDILNSANKDLLTPEFYQSTWFRRIVTIGRCETYSTAIKIMVYDNVTTSNAGTNIIQCETSSAQLNANETAENETGTWSVISPLGYQPISPSDLNNPKATISNLPPNQEVILEWTITNTICNTFSTDQVTVTNYEAPAVTLQEKVIIEYGESVDLNAIVNPHPTPVPYTFNWSPSTDLANAYTLNPKATPSESTTYTLTISYGISCFKTYQITVLVVRDLTMPNAFSPNMDGINDQWVIKNIETQPKSEVSIYNRYGTRIFYSNQYSPWDGTSKGNPVPVGTYYYIIKLNDSKPMVLKGSVTVIR